MATEKVDITNLPLLLTVEEAASIARVSGKHIRDLLIEKKIKGVKLGGVWRVNSDDFINVLGVKK